MARFDVITQSNLNSINLINSLKKDGMYIVLNEFNGYSYICQYSKKYDSFKLINVPTDKLDTKLHLTSGDELEPW